MKNDVQDQATFAQRRPRPHRSTKKQRILNLHAAGITDIEKLADLTDTRPSYVASVLQQAGAELDYFDLYTPTAQPMNVYSKLFLNQLRFKDVEAARQSVALIDSYFRQLGKEGDRAGQHHCLLMALTMFDRARWIGKQQEADVFRTWLLDRLNEAAPTLKAAPAETPPEPAGPRDASPSGQAHQAVPGLGVVARQTEIAG
jgi:hypothetical protein